MTAAEPFGHLDNWSVEESENFAEQAKRLDPNNQERLYRFIDSVTACLGTNPKAGSRLPIKGEQSIWMIASRDSYTSALSPISIFYTFDETCVYLLGIRRVYSPDERQED